MLPDGNKIETTAYQHYLNDAPVDLAIDIATMVGCPMSCKFCASASFPFVRSLSRFEMVGQIEYMLKKHIFSKCCEIMCSFQGVGEPSLIPAEIINAWKTIKLIDNRCKLSISTIGSNLDAFKIWRNCNANISNLQISLGGSTNEQIDYIMPRKSSLQDLIQEARQLTSSSRVEQVKFNYILINNFNDGDDDLKRLVDLFINTSIIIKISYLNPTIASGKLALKSAPYEKAKKFCAELRRNGIDSFIYGAFDDISVSCGQLLFSEITETK
jgi:23S rRNA (adenine2503-C2)-methyltransferase